jgi:hypothetical protein
MNNNTRNKEEFILYALIIGIFFFMLTVLGDQNYSNSETSFNQKLIVTELSDLALSTTLNAPQVIPEYNKLWLTSDCETLKQKPYSESSDFETNSTFNNKYKLCIETYLNIKPNCLKISSSFLYSSSEYAEAPAIA